jgi:hypothetical protein
MNCLGNQALNISRLGHIGSDKMRPTSSVPDVGSEFLSRLCPACSQDDPGSGFSKQAHRCSPYPGAASGDEHDFSVE